MNVAHLLTFSVVARLNSITRAAAHLHLGQPAVSGQLKLLQATVGEPLYERKGHRIALTPAGKGLLEYADRLTADLAAANDYVRCLQRVNAGTLRIGSTTTIASYYLPRYVVQLQTQHPGVQVFMKTGNTREIVLDLADLDLGFIEGSVEIDNLPANFQMSHWRTDEIVLVLHEAHALASQYLEAVPLEVFADHQVIWRERGSGAREVVERALRAVGIDAPVNIEVNGVSAVKESVRAGLGIGFASYQALRHENKGLVARRIDPPVGLVWHLNVIAPKPVMQSRAVRAFLALCAGSESR